MKIPLQITFRNMLPSQAIEDNIREKASKLESFYDRIMGCRVIVEAPHRHHRKGKAYEVRIDLTVPGGELVINRSPKRLKSGEIGRRRQRQSSSKATNPASTGPMRMSTLPFVMPSMPPGANCKTTRAVRAVPLSCMRVRRVRVAKLFPEERYGFLETPDGREIYFHSNSVLQPGFDHLELGAEVLFAEERGKRAPGKYRAICRK